MELLTMCFVIALIAIPTFMILKSYNKKKKIANFIDQLPGPASYPLVGTTLPMLTATRHEKFVETQSRTAVYKPLYRSWFGNRPIVHIMKPEHIEVILRSSDHMSKGFVYDFIHPWLGEGLLTSTGRKWHTSRKLITPTFHFRILEHFQEVFEEKSQLLVQKLKQKADGQFFDVYRFITHCALDIICETAMGVQINAMEKSQSSYVQAVYGVTGIATIRTYSPLMHPNFLFRLHPKGRQFYKYLSVLHEFTNKVIRDRKGSRLHKMSEGTSHSDEDKDLGKKRRLAFLDLLIEASDNGRVLSDTEIREEVDTFMFEGHDTTTAGICWTLFLLGNHSDVQDKVVQELRDIFHGEDRPITMKDLGEMKYLERVIKESLRIYPSVPYIFRSLSKDIELDGLTIPESCNVLIHIYNVHRDARYFPDPERFDPDRFLPENSRDRHPYAFVPFSAGPRNCIGQKFALNEEKTVLATVVKNYEITSMVKQKDLKLVSEMILRPLDGINLSLTPRKF